MKKLATCIKNYGIATGSVVFLLKIVKHPIIILNRWMASKLSRNKKDAIIFQSRPDYSDNSRALSEYLINNGFLNKYDIYWCVGDTAKYNSLYPNIGIKFIPLPNKYNELPFKVHRIIARTKFFFGTHGFLVSKNTLKPNQKCILLWHGCSFKDASPNASKKFFFDKALVAGPIFLETKARYWHTTQEHLVDIGYPRFDWLKKKNPKALAFIDTIKGSCHKILIWMPTFRNDKNGRFNECNEFTQFPLMSGQDDWIKLDQICRLHGVRLVVKLHMFQKDYNIDFSSLDHIKLLSNDDFDKASITMYEFLALTDGLITDYSSIGIDYLVVNKPIAYTLDDFDFYRKNRGFVFEDPRAYMPGAHLYKFKDLERFIEDISNDIDIHNENRSSMKNVAIHQSDCYSKEIVELLNL